MGQKAAVRGYSAYFVIGCPYQPSKKQKKPAQGRLFLENIGRGDMIRTCDFYVPNVALYQAELHPAGAAYLIEPAGPWQQGRARPAGEFVPD